MKNKNKKITIIFIILITLLLITGLSYAYFSANIIGEEDATTITVTGGIINIYYDGGSEIRVNDIIPSPEAFALKTFTVTGNNTTDLEMYYEISIIIEENTFSDDAIKYKLIGTNTDKNGVLLQDITEFNTIKTGTNTLSLGIGKFDSPTNGAKVHTYNLELYFPETNTNQNIDQGKIFKARVEIKGAKKPVKLLTDLILKQGGGVDTILARGTPNYSQINGLSGIYATDDNYGTSYYYRGLKDELNNNLIWAGFQWKIVRINGDGSIRLIYNGTESQFNANKTVNHSGPNTEIISTEWNLINSNDTKYVFYMYGGANGSASTMRHGNTSTAATYNQTSPNIKTILDAWYKTNILDNGYSNMVTDNIFCNDRGLQSEIGGDATGPGYGNVSQILYSGFYRLFTTKNPNIKCDFKNDRFTVNDTTLGNGSLTYPVGLLTADEVAIAGLVMQNANELNYLNSNQLYWLMTPHSTTGNAIVFRIGTTGILEGHNATYKDGVRPSVSLSSLSVVKSGIGSSTDPFIVSEKL